MSCALHVRGEGLSSEMLREVSEVPSMQTGVLRGPVLLTNWLIGVVTLGARADYSACLSGRS